MKIAYLVNQYPKVSHSFIRREITALEACGVEVKRFSIRSCAGELVDPADREELEKTQLVLGVGIFGLLWHTLLVALSRPTQWLNALSLAIKVGWRSDRGLIYNLIYVAEACVLLRWLLKFQIDHVHSHFGTNSTTVAMFCHVLGGTTYSFTVHGPDEFDKAENLALTEKINRAAFVITISSFSKSQLYRWCDRSQWDKIHVVHCGVDDQFFQQSTAFIPDQPNLVCVGRLCEQKGQLLLIEALHQLDKEGVPCTLTLVGDGPMRSQIEALVKEYGLEKQVNITGWASGAEVQKHILNSRAFVLPSFAEGLPVVIMEALALERPVISTYIAGIPELVKPGVNGWLVPAGSVSDLATAIRNVVQLPVEQLEKMGRAGNAQVQQQHDILQEATKLANIFRYSLDEK